jgi:hypothetical protein
MSKIKALLLSVAFAIVILLLSSLMITHPQVMTLMSIIALVIVTYIYLTNMKKKTEKTESELVQPALEFKPSFKCVGSYCLGGKSGMCIWLEKKPNLFHRTMMKVCLGWEWTDVTKNK